MSGARTDSRTLTLDNSGGMSNYRCRSPLLLNSPTGQHHLILSATHPHTTNRDYSIRHTVQRHCPNQSGSPMREMSHRQVSLLPFVVPEAAMTHVLRLMPKVNYLTSLRPKPGRRVASDLTLPELGEAYGRTASHPHSTPALMRWVSCLDAKCRYQASLGRQFRRKPDAVSAPCTVQCGSARSAQYKTDSSARQ